MKTTRNRPRHKEELKGDAAPESKSHGSASSLSQPCASASCAVWPFFSGEQVSSCCQVVGFQSQDFLLWLQNQAFSCLFPHRLHGHWGHPESKSSDQRKRRESKDGLCSQRRTYLRLLVSQEAGRSIGVFGLLSEWRPYGRNSCVQTAIFSWVPPKLTLQPGNQLHRGSGLSSVFLC